MFFAGRAFFARGLEAGKSLRADAYAVTGLEGCDGAADADYVPDYFVADAYGVVCGAPAGSERVNVAATDTAVGDFDINVNCVEGFGSE